jgi:5-methylcytosine-specific restriction endonuclease McrA
MPNVPKKGSKKPWIKYQDLGKPKRQTWKGNDHEDASFYNSRQWRTLRAWVLAGEPLCRQCNKPAAVVDHIKPIRLGGERMDPANLQPLCSSCHNKKSRSERGLKKKEE